LRRNAARAVISISSALLRRAALRRNVNMPSISLFLPICRASGADMKKTGAALFSAAPVFIFRLK